MSDPAKIRQKVTVSYGKAVRATKAERSGCCCGPRPPVSTPVGLVLGGYEAGELEALPADAVASSFGCGNPTALGGLQPGEVVLDLGAGAGIDLLLAARRVGPQGRVIGVDMTAEMVERARQNISDAGLSDLVEVRQGIIEELPVEPASVDVVISNCVINLSPEKRRVFSEIARVLRPGGRMLVSDIVAEHLPPAVRESAELHAACIAGAVSEADYLAGLRMAGLVDVEVQDRLVYDAAQLAAMIGIGSQGCCGGVNLPDAEAAEVAETLAGKVWSVRVYGRKPAV